TPPARARVHRIRHIALALIAAVFASTIAVSAATPVALAATTHTVTWDMGGHGANIEVQVEDGQEPDWPNFDVPIGKTFVDFYVEPTFDTSGYPFGPITQDTTFYAKFVPATYTASFNMQGHGIQIAQVQDGTPAPRRPPRTTSPPWSPLRSPSTRSGRSPPTPCRSP
ncbi:MAG TPA: hypothetical protein PLV68_07275, partial [Ilumatobacteraceae bacterium]|nr:hypothetical protein [Ilumatobacteraceae bacterium]